MESCDENFEYDYIDNMYDQFNDFTGDEENRFGFYNKENDEVLKSRGDLMDELHIERTTTEKKVKGFIMADGTRREYDAPEPPKNLKWEKIYSRLIEWHCQVELGLQPKLFDINSNDMFVLLEREIPDDDFYKITDTYHSIRETLEVLRPFVVSESTSKWRIGAEEELIDRGIKLADSFMISVECQNNSQTYYFGVRAFHVSFRYFVFVILAGPYKRSHIFSDPDNRPVVGFYFVALSQKEAEMNKCV